MTCLKGSYLKRKCRYGLQKGEYFTDDEILKSLKEELTIQIRGLEDEISLIDEKLATYREDLAFVSHLADERHLDAADIERS